MKQQKGSTKSNLAAQECAAGASPHSFPMPIGQHVPGYQGAIALKHRNGDWSIAQSSQVDPTSEWRSGAKVQSGPEMLRAQGYIAWVALDLSTSTVALPGGADATS